MTVNDLIEDLNSIDDDLRDSQVIILLMREINNGTLLTIAGQVVSVDENINSDGAIVLKVK